MYINHTVIIQNDTSMELEDLESDGERETESIVQYSTRNEKKNEIENETVAESGLPHSRANKGENMEEQKNAEKKSPKNIEMSGGFKTKPTNIENRNDNETPAQQQTTNKQTVRKTAAQKKIVYSNHGSTGFTSKIERVKIVPKVYGKSMFDDD